MSDVPDFDPETGEILSDAAGSHKKEASGDQPPPPQAMSLDEARAALVRVHGVAVSTDDPLLMMLTLHQGMLRDYDRMLRSHDADISKLLGATGNACAEAVETVLASLKDKTIKASLDNAFALVERQAVAMDGLFRAMRRHRLVMILLTLLTVVCSASTISILLKIIR